MRKILTELKANEFLNDFNWYGIDCFHKPILIAAESLRKNSSLFYLLFSEIWASSGIDDFFQKQANIRSHWEYKNIKDFFDELKHHIDNNQYIILITNSFYEESSNSYNNEHHAHFTLLKGYDDIEKEFVVIDEDFTKKYYIAKNFVNGAGYIEKALSWEKLFMLCHNIESTDMLNKEKANLIKDNEKYYAYLLLEDCGENNDDISLSEIFGLFSKHLADLIDNPQIILNALTDDVRNIKDIIKNNGFEDSVHNSESFLNSWGMAYPEEIGAIKLHHYKFITQKRFFEIRMENNEFKQKLLQSFDEILGKYVRVRNLITKSFISQNIGILDRVEKYINESMIIEKKLYEFFLNNYEQILKSVQ